MMPRRRSQDGKHAESPGGKKLPAFTEADTPLWLRRALSNLSPAAVPRWLHLGRLPAVEVQGRRLNPSQVRCLLAALRRSTVESEHPLVFALREYADRSSLDAFARRLRDIWTDAGSPATGLWVVNALACLELTD
jgi:hypothetical protein